MTAGADSANYAIAKATVWAFDDVRAGLFCFNLTFDLTLFLALGFIFEAAHLFAMVLFPFFFLEKFLLIFVDLAFLLRPLGFFVFRQLFLEKSRGTKRVRC